MTNYDDGDDDDDDDDDDCDDDDDDYSRLPGHRLPGSFISGNTMILVK